MRAPKKSQLKFSLLNARSLVSNQKLFDLEAFLSENSVEILACTETWFNSLNITDGVLSFNGCFNVVRNDREGRKGGGVLFLIRKPIKYLCVPTLSSFYKHGCEVLAIDLFGCSRKIRIICAYRPPSTSLPDTQNLIRHIESLIPNFRYILTGDFNFPKIDWMGGNIPCDRSHLEFYDLVLRRSMFQEVSFPTREQHGANSILDLILTDDKNLISRCERGPALSNADHFSVSAIINFCVPCSVPDVRYDFARANYIEINRFFASIDWNSVLSQLTNIEDLYRCFLDYLYFAISNYVPLRNFSKRIGYPRYIKQFLERKKMLWKTLKKRPSSNNKLLYNTFAKKVSRCIKKFNIKKESQVLNSRNPKKNCSICKKSSALRFWH